MEPEARNSTVGWHWNTLIFRNNRNKKTHIQLNIHFNPLYKGILPSTRAVQVQFPSRSGMLVSILGLGVFFVLSLAVALTFC